LFRRALFLYDFAMLRTPVPVELLSFLKQHSSFFLIPHIEPDGDCIRSALGLGLFLQRVGKRVYLHDLGPFERKEIKPWASQFAGRIPQELLDKEPDAGVIVLDCSTIDRIGDLAKDIGGHTVAVIDHHSSGLAFGDIRFVNPSSPATSLLVQQVIEELGYTVSADEAEHLFFAFCTDTGFFRHLEANGGDSLRMASRLLDAGASPKRTFGEMNGGAALVGRRHLGVLLSRVESLADGAILLSYELKEETDAIGRQNRESDLLYQMLMGIEGVELVITLREETKTHITGGLRSRTKIDVGKLALSLGGGGHSRAAGFALDGSLATAKERVTTLALEALQKA